MAKKAGIARLSAQRILDRMEAEGRIIVNRAPAGAKGRPSNSYRLRDVALLEALGDMSHALSGTDGPRLHARSQEYGPTGPIWQGMNAAYGFEKMSDNPGWFERLSVEEGVRKEAVVTAPRRIEARLSRVGATLSRVDEVIIDTAKKLRPDLLNEFHAPDSEGGESWGELLALPNPEKGTPTQNVASESGDPRPYDDVPF